MPAIIVKRAVIGESRPRCVRREAMGGCGLLAALTALAVPLPAQIAPSTSAAVAKAVETITEADVARRIRIIADDSMLGRATPSAGLEQTAQYVADQFQRFGLTPGGDSGTWFQRYPVPGFRRLDVATSRVVFAAGGMEAAASFASAARLAAQVLPRTSIDSSPVVLIAGRHTPQSATAAAVRGKAILYVPPPGLTWAQQVPVLQALLFTSGTGLIILSDQDSATFAARRQASLSDLQVGIREGAPWAVHVWPAAVQAALAAGGLALARARAATTPVVRALPRLTVRLDVAGEAATAPNTVGLLEGSDPALKNEYLVISAHMDHLGVLAGSGEADSINNGADDNASGTAGVLELAEAFSRPGARPRRSLLFVTFSGEEHGLWGSKHFVAHPPVPLTQLVANVNLDMIGRNWTDTVAVIGKGQSDLGATLDTVVQAHPELRMTAIDDPWPRLKLSTRSDHASFAKRKIPMLFFFSGLHDDYHQVTDAPATVDAEKEARLLRLVFHLGRAVGNAVAKPKLYPDRGD